MANYTFLTLAIFLVAGTVMVSNINLVAAQCGANVPELVSQCSSYVQPGGQPTAPSAACCDVIKPIDIPCACKLISNIENYVDPKKAVFVARSCGKTVPAGMHCGCKILY
ncbi:hypothetical protein L6164_026005 [Bauhinia variegata]|uniref:Uncharacterized protein n=1 Tax=Bauhinia variegata TaxID=167791 RepID=A0ACB9M2P6_BAUVA|nr:hypothetical protein L6164_026005 [Bauhinia variegata]